MLVPYNVDVPMERWPVANWFLIAVTVLVSFVLLVGGRPRVARPAEGLDGLEGLEEYRKYADRFAERGPPAGSLDRNQFRVWQLVTYTLAHAGLLHLAGNVVFLFCFGNAVNAKLGHGVFLGLYFFLGAVAGIAWLLFGRGPALVGASGAIMGVVGLFLVLYPDNDVRVFYWFGFTGMGTFEVRSWVVALFAVASDLFGTIFFGGGPVAYICHLGGMVVGVGVGLGMLGLGFAAPGEGEVNLLQLWGVHPPTKRRPRSPRRDIPLPVSRPDGPARDEDWER